MWIRICFYCLEKRKHSGLTPPTDVVGQEVGGEALGAVAERRVVVRVAAEDEQRPAEEGGRVQVARVAALPQDEPGTKQWTRCKNSSRLVCVRAVSIRYGYQISVQYQSKNKYGITSGCIWNLQYRHSDKSSPLLQFMEFIFQVLPRYFLILFY